MGSMMMGSIGCLGSTDFLDSIGSLGAFLSFLDSPMTSATSSSAFLLVFLAAGSFVVVFVAFRLVPVSKK